MLEHFSLGTGDRFGKQGEAQLRAVQKARKEYNTLITPVWNKSHREHSIIGTTPKDVQKEADAATQALGWEQAYCVDADHITKEIVKPYIPYSNFFTIDVAEFIGKEAGDSEKELFMEDNADLIGAITIPGIDEEFTVTHSFLEDWADQYLLAIKKARQIYEYIKDRKMAPMVHEISMDEVSEPQTPIELYFILKAVAREQIPINTIAPKFTGDFYKGVDYEGSVEQFAEEFEQHILVIEHMVDKHDLPADLKLSVHSGSDKFSLYPHMNRLIGKYGAGLHLKTAGTTWLEELIGLAVAGPDGLSMVKHIYSEAYERYDELTAPYKQVVDIGLERLPSPDIFNRWNGEKIEAKMEHDTAHPAFDSQLRQFLHCSYKIAAELENDFTRLLDKNANRIGDRVTRNLFEKHINPLFLGSQGTAEE